MDPITVPKKTRMTNNEYASRYREKHRQEYNAYIQLYMNTDTYKIYRKQYNAMAYHRRKERLANLPNIPIV